jgi:hypothetical protein
MKKFYLPALGLAVMALLITFLFSQAMRPKKADAKNEEENEMQYRKELAEYEFNILKDPVTGMIPEDARQKEMEASARIPAKGTFGRTENLNTYTTAGPFNIGGRTRCVQYDIRYDGTSNRVLIAGGVNGGIFKSTDGGATWVWKNTADIHSVTSIVQDTRIGISPITGQPYRNTWYAGTGEFQPSSYAPGAFLVGHGLFVSDDNGETWRPINASRIGSIYAFDAVYDLVNRIVVSPNTGDVFVARLSSIGKLTRLGVDSFQSQQVLGPSSLTGINSGNQVTDIVINNAGKMYAAFSGENPLSASNPVAPLEGIWESTTGALGSWTKIASSTINTAWPAAGNYGRVVLALAPSDQTQLFALYDNLQTDNPSGTLSEAGLCKIDMSTPGSYSYTDLSSNMPFFDQTGRGFQIQGGYDMAITIKPNDPNTIIIGGVNAIRSTDGFTSTSNQTVIGGYTYAGNPGLSNTHPDHHWFTWRPGSNTEMLMSDDGGIRVTTNISATPVAFTPLNNQYQVAQYYFVTIDPTNGEYTFMGGTQDNQCHFRNGLSATPNNHSQIAVGDGFSVGISTPVTGTKYLYVSSYDGSIRRLTVDAATNTNFSGQTIIKPTGSTSEFITQFYLNPENTSQLYFAGLNKLYRTTNASSVTSGTWTQMTGYSNTFTDTIRSFATTRGTYNSNHILLIGTSRGRILRLADPANAAATTAPVQIYNFNSPVNVIDIAVNPRNADTAIAVVSNYGTTFPHIVWTGNATAASPTWTNIEGNLIGPSMRSCEVVLRPNGSVEYYVGTSAGMFSTTTVNGASTSWVKEGVGTPLEFAIVSSLAQRYTDYTMVVGTHGNGMWYTNYAFPTGVNPVLNDKRFIVSAYPTVTRNNLIYQTGTISGIRNMDMCIVDMNGRIVWQNKRAFQNGSIPVDHLSAGNYVLSIWSDNRKYQYVTKFIKQ